MLFRVTVEKQQTVSGTIVVQAKNADAAIVAVNKLMNDKKNPLQTNDARIEWDEPVYDDDSFKVTGDVDRE